MGYKKDKLYVVCRALLLLSIAVMSVSFVFMGFGKDGAIIWFFGASPFLLVSMWIMQSVKRRYIESDDVDGKPIPMFESVHYRIDEFRFKLQTEGKVRVFWRLGFYAVTVVAVVCLVICGNAFYRGNGQLKAPIYLDAKSKYSAAVEAYDAALISGDTLLADSSLADMKHYKRECEYFEGVSKQYKAEATRWLIIGSSVALIDIILGVGYLVALKKGKFSVEKGVTK